MVIVSETLAENHWPGEDAVGKRVDFWDESREVIGVVRTTLDVGRDPRGMVYLSVFQSPQRAMSFTVRTAGEPAALVPAIRTAVREVEKGAPLFRVGTMTEWLSESTARPRFTAVLLCVFAAIALILSATGLYGVTSSHVAVSRRSIGIRVALGASPRQAVGRVFARAGLMAGSGLVAGLAASLAAAKVIRGMLFQVEPAAPATYLVVTLVLALVVLAACAVPAWRAATVDPAEALRCE